MTRAPKVENILREADCAPVALADKDVWGPFLVLSAEIHRTWRFTCTGTAPHKLDHRGDILVAPPSMDWTMAFDHEAMGPYFATR